MIFVLVVGFLFNFDVFGEFEEIIFFKCVDQYIVVLLVCYVFLKQSKVNIFLEIIFGIGFIDGFVLILLIMFFFQLILLFKFFFLCVLIDNIILNFIFQLIKEGCFNLVV